MVVVLVSITLPAFAQYQPEKKEFPGKRQLTKLGRGLANIFGGWAEIPKEVYNQSKNAETLGSVVFTAPVIGIGKAVARTAVGVFETITFFLPVPANYEPVIQPEYVF
jgi:putative exosortase-associated protein (TIGR04073 family)